MLRPVLNALLLALAACGRGEPARDLGPAPDASHQALVRQVVDGLLDARHRLESPSSYRFAAPVQDRAATWLFDPPDRERHELGYAHGWCVEFWVTPHYAGYPKQPESHRMAFFAEGKLRGIFSEGTRNAPLELDKWTPTWTDVTWRPAAPGR